MLDFQTIEIALPDAHLLQRGATDWAVTSVASDSRAVTPGTLFVAVQGGSVDGHHYIPAAVAQGAVAVVGTKTPAELKADGFALPSAVTYWRVSNARLALARVAAALYGNPSAKLAVIGITGTDGKTSTSTLLESILRAATRTPANQAGDVGVVTTVVARIRGEESDTGLHVTTPDAPDVQRYLAVMRDVGCRYAVIESTSHGLDQDRVGAVAFDIAAVTNITHEHLDYHGTRDAYVQAKAKLFRALFHTPVKPGIARAAVINADDDGSHGALVDALNEEQAHTGVRVARRAYGVRATAQAAQEALTGRILDVCAADVVLSPQGTVFTLHWWGGSFSLTTPLIGDFNVYNVTCAVTVALALGLPPTAIQAGVAEMTGVSGRMERIDAGQDFLALVDFAHSPASLERALLTLQPLVGVRADGSPGRLIAVFGSAGLRDRAKRGLMGQVSGRLADVTIITAEDPRTEDLAVINQAIEAGVVTANPDADYTIVPDRTDAIQTAINMAQSGDVVAAFGKGHERSMCFGTTEYPWSDQDAMQKALEQRIARAKGDSDLPE